MSAVPAGAAETAVQATPSPNRAKLYDFLAALPLIAWYVCILDRLLPTIVSLAGKVWAHNWQFLPIVDLLSKSAILLFTAVMVALLVIRRPAMAKARGFVPRIVALLGCYLGMALVALPLQPVGWIVELVSTAMIMGGMSFALYGLLFLGRSFSIMSEARRLVVGGPYSVVRHPLYLGEEISLVGVALQYVSPLAIAILVLQVAFQLYRMGFEEQVLAETFPEYDAYKARTARLIPGIY